MRSLAWALLVGASLAATSGREPPRQIIFVSSSDQLVKALEGLTHDVTLRLAPGRYLVPGDAIMYGEKTVGLTISGRNVRIVGEGQGSTMIATTASVAVRIVDCPDCALDSITTGSVRIENSSVDVSDCLIAYAELVQTDASNVRVTNSVVEAGISANNGHLVVEHSEVGGGISAGSGHLVVEYCEIGSGIELHGSPSTSITRDRPAHAEIRHNLIEGPAGQGDAGIVISGPAIVIAERNHIRGFMTGIQLQGDASLECTANIIEDIRGNGIWGTLPGLGRVSIRENAIFHCGSSGIALRADGDQNATRNLVVETGLEDPKKSAVLVAGARSDAAVRKNTLYNNTVTDEKLDRDVPREAFWRARRPWTRTYRNNPVGVDGRHKFYESAFLTRYGRWAD